MQDNGNGTSRLSSATDWRELAAKASNESDPQKLSELVRQLCERLDEVEQQKKALSSESAPPE